MFQPAKTIDEVIDQLEDILEASRTSQDPAGYFAALYQKVTITIRDKVAEGYFDDNPRMEKLDVVFANRYLEAYALYKGGEEPTESWRCAFAMTTRYWPIVLQHLLIGMNAHINLDLGIAAAQISTTGNIENLEGDFNKINEVLGSLVDEVERDLAEIWPALIVILKLFRNVDNFLINFSMKIARDGAWKFANEIVGQTDQLLEDSVAVRDEKIANLSGIISLPGWIERLLFGLIRITEKGSVADKIRALEE